MAGYETWFTGATLIEIGVSLVAVINLKHEAVASFSIPTAYNNQFIFFKFILFY